VAVIVLVMVLLDAAVADTVKRWPRSIIRAVSEFSDFGKSGWFLWPLGLCLLAIAAVASPSLSRMSLLVLTALSVRIGFLFVAIAVPGLTVTIAKRLIGRARPRMSGAADPFLYMLFVWRPDYASLPSGHATTAFAAATAFGLLWPRLYPPLVVFAIAIAVSRVVVDAHFVSDVVAGALVGTCGALLVRDWFAARRLGFVVGQDGRVCALPGPSLRRIKSVARGPVGP
jgi:undecaprenyl-diphosphatase